MPASPRPATPFARLLLRIGAVVAIVAQVGLVVAPLAEVWQGQDAAAHVEAGGTSTHYAHNDATCAACQARTLIGLAVASAAPVLRTELGDARVVPSRDFRPAAGRFSPNNPRAPPTPLSI